MVRRALLRHRDCDSGRLFRLLQAAGAIVHHAPHWLVGDNHDRIFMTAFVAYFFSILPWSIALAFVSTSLKVVARRIARDTKEK